MDHFKDSTGREMQFLPCSIQGQHRNGLDFASDEKPEKNIARKMMKMTAKINKKFFKDNKQ